MRNYVAVACALLVAGCAIHRADRFDTDEDDEVRMSVRLVKTNSDVALIRPDYQIVIGSGIREYPLARAVVWDSPAPAALYMHRPIQEAPTVTSETLQVQPATTSTSDAKIANKSIFLTEAHFEFGSASLTPKATSMLDEVAVDIRQLTPKRLSIVGHTDNVGGDAANQKLSERRAEAVFEYLRKKGVKVQDVDRVGFGERAPASSNESEEGRAKNRRAEVMATVEK